MTRNIRKFVRDLLVTLAGAALLFVVDNIASLGLPPEVAAIVAPVALVAYRSLRDRVDVLADIDDIR